MNRRIYLIFWCASVALLAFVALDFWSLRNAPIYKRFERQWTEDVQRMESSGKLPHPWFDVNKIEIIGGTPETKSWLRRIKVPLSEKRENGGHKLEVLVVAWEENGKRGVLLQYNLIKIKTGNTVWEAGRTLLLNPPDFKTSLKNLVNIP